MTGNLQDDAKRVYVLLCAARLTDDLHYDGNCMVKAKQVYVYFTAYGVDIMFCDPYDGAVNTTMVDASNRYTAIATIVEGLLRVLYSNLPTSATEGSSSAADGAS